jgi:endonuclease YncB( thermonuclease family)
MRMSLAVLLINFAIQAVAGEAVLTGKVTHVHDGDTIEVNDVAIRL